jgi:hypothetical protein
MTRIANAPKSREPAMNAGGRRYAMPPLRKNIMLTTGRFDAMRLARTAPKLALVVNGLRRVVSSAVNP